VLGIDLSIAEPQDSLPQNCQFLKVDAENDEWPAQSLDYIHFGYVISCFDDTKVTDDDSVKGTAIEEWVETTVKGGKTVGRDLCKSTHYGKWLKETGFVNVQDVQFQLPINEWPENPKLKQIGAIYKHNLLGLLESLAQFLTHSGLSNSEAGDLKERAKRDIHDPQIRYAFPLYVCRYFARFKFSVAYC
jgi:hypothetical protein